MPGHNGGFNPFRDANGEFTSPAGAGKPGRSRATSAVGSGSASTKRGGTPPKVVAGKWSTKAQKSNPHAETQFWSTNTGHRQGLSSPQVGYRAKGQNIFGVKSAPRTPHNPAGNPGATYTPTQPSARAKAAPKARTTNPHQETQFWSDNTGHRQGQSSSQVGYRGKGQNIYGVKVKRTK